MTEIEILEEIVKIQGKYLRAVESMGTIQMSPQDRQRITFLEGELEMRMFYENKYSNREID